MGKHPGKHDPAEGTKPCPICIEKAAGHDEDVRRHELDVAFDPGRHRLPWRALSPGGARADTASISRENRDRWIRFAQEADHSTETANSTDPEVRKFASRAIEVGVDPKFTERDHWLGLTSFLFRVVYGLSFRSIAKEVFGRAPTLSKQTLSQFARIRIRKIP